LEGDVPPAKEKNQKKQLQGSGFHLNSGATQKGRGMPLKGGDFPNDLMGQGGGWKTKGGYLDLISTGKPEKELQLGDP